MLLDRLFTDPFRRIWSLVHTLVCPGAALRAAIAAEELAAEVELNSAMKEDAHRVSFDRSLPSICSLFRRMLQRLTLKEPTFQEAVVIYSEITSMVDHEIESYGGVVPMRQRLSDDQADSSGPERPVLRLKSFRDIPIADVEVVLPGLKVDRMKSADIVKLAIILLAGIATAIYSYVFATIGGWTVRATLIGLLLLRAFQTWRSLVLAKLTMDDFIRTTLYCRSQDSQRGVLLSILNSIERHEHRETLTLYLLMRHHLISQSTDPAAAGVSGGIPATGGISASEAELMCSEFLREEFGIGVRIHATEAIRRLERLGLLTKQEESRYLPLPIEQAIKQLHRSWGEQRPSSGVAPRQPPSLQALVSQQSISSISH